MKLLLFAYPRWWRDRYAEELVALLEAEPLSWRVRANVIAAGLRERWRGAGPPHARLLWAWSLFVVGGMAFQKTSEHWQTVVAADQRALPTVAFDVVQSAAVIGTAAILVGVALTLPALLRDLQRGGWATLRRPTLFAAAATAIAAVGLVGLALDHDILAVSVFVVFAVASLFAWTHVAALATRRLQLTRAPCLPRAHRWSDHACDDHRGRRLVRSDKRTSTILRWRHAAIDHRRIHARWQHTRDLQRQGAAEIASKNYGVGSIEALLISRATEPNA